MKILRGPSSDEPATEAGWTLVMRGESGELAILDDQRLGFFDRLFGKRKYYQVFTASHRLEFRFDLQSAQSTYRFNAHVTAMAEVRDAVAAVRQGVSDTTESLRQPIEEALQQAVRPIDFRQSDKAWSEGLAALKALNHSVIRLSDIVLKIEIDADAREKLRTIEGQQLEVGAWQAAAQINKLERDEFLESFETLDKLLALLMTTKDSQKRGMIKEAIALKTQRDTHLTQWQIETFKYLVDSGRYEEHEIPKGLSNLLAEMNRTWGGKLPPTPLLGSEPSAEGTESNSKDKDEADGT